jgi:hypothetical protein
MIKKTKNPNKKQKARIKDEFTIFANDGVTDSFQSSVNEQAIVARMIELPKITLIMIRKSLSKSKDNKLKAKKVAGSWANNAMPSAVRIKPIPSSRVHENLVIVLK